MNLLMAVLVIPVIKLVTNVLVTFFRLLVVIYALGLMCLLLHALSLMLSAVFHINIPSINSSYLIYLFNLLNHYLSNLSNLLN